ncbi:hypothetical protein BGW80DRAFT_1248650 [Lactifluus volemus]|nr:hypothetical protein BGW80DRAFT_1248650 [Lactifluus volemus]
MYQFVPPKLAVPNHDQHSPIFIFVWIIGQPIKMKYIEKNVIVEDTYRLGIQRLELLTVTSAEPSNDGRLRYGRGITGHFQGGEYSQKGQHPTTFKQFKCCRSTNATSRRTLARTHPHKAPRIWDIISRRRTPPSGQHSRIWLNLVSFYMTSSFHTPTCGARTHERKWRRPVDKLSSSLSARFSPECGAALYIYPVQCQGQQLEWGLRVDDGRWLAVIPDSLLPLHLDDGHVFTKNGTYKTQDVPQSCDSLQIVAILGLLASLSPRLLLGLSDDIVLMGLEHGELAARTRKLRGAMCNNLTPCGIQVRYARRPHRHGEMNFRVASSQTEVEISSEFITWTLCKMIASATPLELISHANGNLNTGSRFANVHFDKKHRQVKVERRDEEQPNVEGPNVLVHVVSAKGIYYYV